MNDTNTPTQKQGTSRKVAESRRMGFLPKTFYNVRVGMAVESSAFSTMDQIATNYRGGMWDFIEVPGGGYLAPAGAETVKLNVQVAGNGFDGELSLDAAGIVASLFAINHTLMVAYEAGNDPVQEVLTDRYYALRDFASNHPERQAIFNAID